MSTVQCDLFGNPLPVQAPKKQPRTDADVRAQARERERQREKARRQAGNPLIPIVGPGPTDARCKTCRYLWSHTAAKTYYKCEHRGEPTKGSATDHRANWPACALYIEKPAPRRIRASVLSVGTHTWKPGWRSAAVVLDQGSEDGITIGMIFSARKRGETHEHLVVEEIKPDSALCRVGTGSLAHLFEPFAVGDVVEWKERT